MNVAIEIPEDISSLLQAKWRDVPGRTREIVAAEGYRSGALTAQQVGSLLGHSSRWETEAFLKRANVYIDYSDADLDRDLATLEKLRGS